MGLIVSVCGFLILAYMTFLLFLLSFMESLRHLPALLACAVGLPVLVGLTYATCKEWRSTLQEDRRISYRFDALDIANFLAVFSGAVVTYLLSKDFALGPVVAAGVVGILAALVLPRYGVPIYCGAFAGMSCSLLFSTYAHMAFGSVLAGIVFVLSKHVFNGFGGKLGTIAFTGCLVAALLPGKTLHVAPVPGWDQGRLIVVYAVLGAVLTFVLSIRFKHGPVMASGIIGLVGGLLLPSAYGTFGTTLGVVVICASFAGMSSPQRLPNEAYMLVAGILCGLVFIFSSPYLGGAGGKLGTIAFGSGIALRGIVDLVAQAKVWAEKRGGAKGLCDRFEEGTGEHSPEAQLEESSVAGE